MFKKSIFTFVFLILFAQGSFAWISPPLGNSDPFNFGDNYLGYAEVPLGSETTRVFFGWAGEGMPWFDVILHNQTTGIGITEFVLNDLGNLNSFTVRAQDWQNNTAETSNGWTGWSVAEQGNGDQIASGVPIYSNDFYNWSGRGGNIQGEYYDQLHISYTFDGPLSLAQIQSINFAVKGIDVTGQQFESSGVFRYTNENPVPEPSTMLLFGMGLLGLAGTVRKKIKS